MIQSLAALRPAAQVSLILGAVVVACMYPWIVHSSLGK